MKISIIIPTFKPGKYIENCFRSIGKQTFNIADFEVIIVLNGCSEPWKTMIKDYVVKYLPNHIVRLIQTDIAGVSNARNIAIDVAKGDFIAFIDDDDYISPTYLDELIKLSSSNCVALTDSIYFDDETGKMNYDNPHHNDFLRLRNCQSPSLFQVRRFLNGPVMKLVHRDIIGKRRFDLRFANGEDSLFMALISDRIKRCRFCPAEAIYYRRVRLNSATTKSRSIFERVCNSFKAIIQYTIYWIKRPLDYNPAFYISRIMAQFKVVVLR